MVARRGESAGLSPIALLPPRLPCYSERVFAAALTPYWPLLVSLPFAVVDWVAAGRGLKRLEYVFKPLTMGVIIAAVVHFFPVIASPWYRAWFLGAFTLSFGGDVFLMLDGERAFRAGLASFLMAQLVFIVGFNQTLPPVASVYILVPVGIIAAHYFARLAPKLREGGRGALVVPVALYSIVLSLMFYSALATLMRRDWPLHRAVVAAVGGFLFFMSDSVLAWHRLVRPLRGGSVVIHVTYHLAQMLLALSIMTW
ncbi:MAG: lysoplasmalogenase [bacterium]